MNCSDWRRALPQRASSPTIRSWLREPESLTARLQGQCQGFRVRLVRQGLDKVLRDEVTSPTAARCRLPVREVLLECDGVPVIFAHTIVSTATRGALSLWLARLGVRSLGSLLFSHPGFVRGPLEYRRLDGRHPLYQRAAGFASLPPQVWARRSRHRLGGQEVMVTEVFLPAIGRLPR